MEVGHASCAHTILIHSPGAWFGPFDLKLLACMMVSRWAQPHYRTCNRPRKVLTQSATLIARLRALRQSSHWRRWVKRSMCQISKTHLLRLAQYRLAIRCAHIINLPTFEDNGNGMQDGVGEISYPHPLLF